MEQPLSHLLGDDWVDFERLNVTWVCDPEFSFPRRHLPDQMQACWRDSMGSNRRILSFVQGGSLNDECIRMRAAKKNIGSLKLDALPVWRRNGIWRYPGITAESGEHFGSCRYNCKAPSTFKPPCQLYIPVSMKIFVILRANLLQNQVK